MKTTAFLLAIIVAFFAYWYFHRPITYPVGVLINDEPVQSMLSENEPDIGYGEFHLKPLARFSINARVLHRKIYRFDRVANLVPVDLAVGWGPMSDQSVLDRLKITQSMRFYWYEYRSPPIPQGEIISHSTNVHVIPATATVDSFCRSLRQGALIHLEGELVEATGPEIGSVWRSSLTRTDTGNGACELMLVEDCWMLGQAPNKSATLVKR